MLAGCLWLSANLGELAYAARDMNQMLLAVGAVGIILLLALTRRLYEKVQNDAKKLRLFKGALACAVVLAVVGGVLALSRMGGGLVLALLAAALPVQDEPDEPLLGRRTGFGVLGIILCVAAASLVVALNWTPLLAARAAAGASARQGKPQRLCAARPFPRGGTGRHRLYTVDPAAGL